MSVSDDRPEPEVQQGEVEAALAGVLEDIEAIPPLLSGEPVDVVLTIKVANAMTPQEAVDQFMQTLGRNGSDAVYFFIEDESTGETFAIKGGVLYDPEQLIAEHSSDDDDDDEPDQ